MWSFTLLTCQSLAAILRVVTLAETTKAKTHRLEKVEVLFNSFFLEFITVGDSVRF